MDEELYIPYVPEIVAQYLKQYYVQYVYCGWVLLRLKAHS